jgi:alpha-glucosidase (family GH31 glycosyl hydrolase)
MTGDNFTLKIFLGPKLSDIYRQIGIGIEKLPLDFWQLGVHVCKIDGGNITESTDELDKLLKEFPFDSHCIDSSLFYLISSDPEDSTIQGFQNAIGKLKEQNRKILLYFTPHLLVDDKSEIFQESISKNLLLKFNETEFYEGLDHSARKISYFDVLTKQSEISNLLSKYKHKFEMFNASGIFTDTNFPFDFFENQTHSYLEDFEFIPKNFANHLENIIPLNTKLANNNESFINDLNQYSSKQIEMFKRVLSPDLFIADSYNQQSDVGSLVKAIELNWVDFRKVVYKLVFMSTVNFKIYGSLVCGGYRAIPEDLCVRWYQFSAFVPLFLVDSEKLPGTFTINVRRMIIEAVKM